MPANIERAARFAPCAGARCASPGASMTNADALHCSQLDHGPKYVLLAAGIELLSFLLALITQAHAQQRSGARPSLNEASLRLTPGLSHAMQP